LEGQGMADSVFEENWKPSTITSFFGHRHLPMKVSVGKNSEYVNGTGLRISLMAF
jgi:hypothetical protein